MKVLAKSHGETTELDIEANPIKVLVMQNGIKVDVPEALEISSDTTIKCMKDMSQKAWEHISTGELFKHFYFMLFGADRYLPITIEGLNDEDRGTIHGTGLIIQLIEARFESVPKVFLRTPEDHLHPKQTIMLMSVVLGIQKIPLGGDMEVTMENPNE